jgi:hypothetical protein
MEREVRAILEARRPGRGSCSTRTGHGDGAAQAAAGEEVLERKAFAHLAGPQKKAEQGAA